MNDIPWYFRSRLTSMWVYAHCMNSKQKILRSVINLFCFSTLKNRSDLDSEKKNCSRHRLYFFIPVLISAYSFNCAIPELHSKPTLPRKRGETSASPFRIKNGGRIHVQSKKHARKEDNGCTRVIPLLLKWNLNRVRMIIFLSCFITGHTGCSFAEDI